MFLRFSLILTIFALLACSTEGEAQADPVATRAPAVEKPVKEPPMAVKQAPLGVSDTGIWSDLDNSVALPRPRLDGPGTLLVDEKRQLVVVYAGRGNAVRPLKVYPIEAASRFSIKVGGRAIALRRNDRAELAPLATRLALVVHAKGEAPMGGDADGDGIPNILDLLIGAKKTVLNAASYGAGYIRLEYPGGDVPRDVGVCSDVVIRAVRNAGVDLQSALHKDIRRAKKSYPMVKRRNSHIDHRRVKTLLPYFVRHWDKRDVAVDAKSDPLRAGDVVFMDTFPNRRGPDHIGIISERIGPSGHPLVINNWTDGSVTAELDLLDWVPVTHRFRMKATGR